MANWGRRGDLCSDVRLILGGVAQKARGVLGGVYVVYPALPGGASGTGGMVSGRECCACPGHLHSTYVADRHDLGTACSSRDRRRE